MLGVVGDRAHVLVARGEIDAHEAVGMGDRAPLAHLVPDRERVVDPARIEMIEVGGPVLDRRTLAHGSPLRLDDLDRELGAVRLGEVGLVLQAGRHRAVALLARVAVLVELEQLRRQRLAAVVTLALVAIDADAQTLGVDMGFLLASRWPLRVLIDVNVSLARRAAAGNTKKENRTDWAKSGWDGIAIGPK